MKEIASICLPIPTKVNTMVELLRYRAKQQPQQIAFTFLADGETQTGSLTYAELDCLSRRIASKLQQLNLVGERALLLYPSGLEYLAAFFGCLCAGVIAVPAYPPTNKRNSQRIRAIVADSEANIVLTTAELLPSISSFLEKKSQGCFCGGCQNPCHKKKIKYLSTDNLEPNWEKNWQYPQIKPDSLAFLQYTSGSTGNPKGVMVTHGNMIHNAAMTYQMMGHSDDSKFVSWLPIYHDMGLIGGIIQPFYGGFPCYFMPPAAFMQRPYRWLKAISRYQATTSGAPNFAYELCVEKITSKQLASLDLSSWQVAFNGAEPIRNKTLEGFSAKFASCGFRPEAFYPCYGMAEATLMISGGHYLKAEKVFTDNLMVGNAHPTDENDLNSKINNHKPRERSGAKRTSTNYEPRTTNHELSSCGKGLADQKIVIVNPETCKICLPDEVGEIWVAGESIAQGYWQRAEETAETFAATIADTGESPFLRTGDLGFIKDGELFVTGRWKDLIIIRGRNLYPQDIELTAAKSHPSLQVGSSAAFTVEVDNEEQLVVVQELEFRQRPDLAEVIKAIRGAIATEYEVQTYAIILIKPGSILKTSSGKIQRRPCREQFLKGELKIVFQDILELSSDLETNIILTREDLLNVNNEEQLGLIESYLQRAIAEVLKVNKNRLQNNQSLTSLGVDSLKVFQLKNKIEVDLGVEIEIKSWFEAKSIKQLSQLILTAILTESSIKVTIKKYNARNQEHPLSLAQERFWFLESLESGNQAYNIEFALELDGLLDINFLEKSLNQVIAKHETLRTCFTTINGQPVQIIEPLVNLSLNVEKLNIHITDGALPSLNVEELNITGALPSLNVEELNITDGALRFANAPYTRYESHVFDLAQAPLLNAKLLVLEDNKYILFLNLHHIITDGWSIEILLQEIANFYNANQAGIEPNLTKLSINYLDFSYWQRERIKGELGDTQLAYWQKKLAGVNSVLPLPTDYPRPPIQTYNGAEKSIQLSLELTEKLQNLAQQEGVTLFMLLLAAFKTLLYRYTGQENLCVGSPIANRNYQETQDLIGLFVNTLVLRSDLSGNQTFTELLQQVRQTAIEAYTHQDLPFEQIVEVLKPERDLSHTPLFQVTFAVQNSPSLPEIEGLNLKKFPLEKTTAQFDLSVTVEPNLSGTIIYFEYNTDLFKGNTITRMMGHFQNLLNSIIEQPSAKISELSLLDETEKEELLIEFNKNYQPIIFEQCIHNLFEAKVAEKPNNIAVVFGQEKLTYQELNYKANQLTHYLQELGVKPEIKVGIYLERGLAQIIAILAVLKAGGAYVPLDPDYGQERIDFILAESQLLVLITQSWLQNKLSKNYEVLVCLDSEEQNISNQSKTNPKNNLKTYNLAYITYTSGSSGKPKGVAIEHGGLMATYTAWENAYSLSKTTSSHLQMANFTFDVFTGDLIRALASGGKLVICPKDIILRSENLYQLMIQENIDCADFVPAVLINLINYLERTQQSLDFMSLLVVGSDRWYIKDYQKVKRFCGNKTRLINAYGVTESTIDSCYFTGTKITLNENQFVPIGRPFSHTKIYILDRNLNPVPVGITGDLYISGTALARGYVNQPQLTEERFLENSKLRIHKVFSSPYDSALPTCDSRLYKTGDLARYLPDGNIEFLGRADDQVKVRGFRIELGEIEAVLQQHSAIKEAVVIIVEKQSDQKFLVAYFVPHHFSINIQGIKSYLQKYLPNYMIPNSFVMLQSLPFNANGKVDRLSLSKLDNIDFSSANYTAPRNEIERVIAGIWQEVLKLEKVGIYDNFFDLGGHSLLIAQVQSKLQDKLNKSLQITDLFKHPNISSLADYLTQENNKKYSFNAINTRAEKQKIAMNKRRAYHRQSRDK